MHRTALVIAPLSLAVATTALALPPGAAERGFRDGANHHLGDDSFVARVGRAPTPTDSEPLRMRTHLQYVRELLAQRPPTRPELAARRAELLGYLDDYIARGVAPRNEALPWRSPVFIDDDGHICAVGYAGERPDEDGEDGEDAGSLENLPELLAANMVWYIEWPHIDRRFIRLFKTIPGYWRGRPNSQVLPESEREQLEDIADTDHADAALPL